MQTPPAVAPNDELLRFLARQPLFADLPPADLAPLAAVVRRRHYPRGAVIFTQGDLGSFAFHDAAIRLAETLWRVSQTDGALRVARIHQDDLAARVGVSRQTVNRVLGEWRRRGLVSVARGEIRLPDPQRFAAWRAELAASTDGE